MSEIKLNLLDSHTTLIATVHGSVGDALVAALSADPATLEELESVLKRFEKCDSIPASSLYRCERCAIDEEPYDAGILVIDLAARIVACKSTYSLPGRDGTVAYHDGHSSTGFPIVYRLSDDWIFLRSIDEYRARCEDRITERAAAPPLDTRAILYGEPLLDYIIQSVRLLNLRRASACRELPDAPDVRQASSACRDLPDTRPQEHSPISTEPNLLPEAVVDIHRRWLINPRNDLKGQSPRQILFNKRELIDFDLESRMLQWSYFLEEPASLSRDSYAYRFGGFGTHELVMYYYMVRFLIWEAADRIIGRPTSHDGPSTDESFSFTPSFSLGPTSAEQSETVSTVSNQTLEGVAGPVASTEQYNEALLTELEQLKQKWLSEPNPELDGQTPLEVIDNERRRRPEAMTGRSMVIDEDCPCCKMMGDESEAGLGVYFCHFDGCNMEDEFAFSSCATLEDWAHELREREECDRPREQRECDEPLRREKKFSMLRPMIRSEP